MKTILARATFGDSQNGPIQQNLNKWAKDADIN
jgi:hypothetical protein